MIKVDECYLLSPFFEYLCCEVQQSIFPPSMQVQLGLKNHHEAEVEQFS